MIEGRFQAPRAVRATDARGAAAIDALVGRRRAELARLSLSSRTASQRLDAALAALEAAPASVVPDVPEDLLAVVDTMLQKAVRVSEVAIDAAHGEADFILATALAERADLLRRSGVEPRDLSVVDLDRSAGKGSSRRVIPPPAASEMWSVITDGARPAPIALVPTPPPEPSAAQASEPSSMGVAPMVGRDQVRPMVDGEPVPTQAAVATLLLDEPHPDGVAGSPDAFDAFWQEATHERRVRDRLRRRNPKEGA